MTNAKFKDLVKVTYKAGSKDSNICHIRRHGTDKNIAIHQIAFDRVDHNILIAKMCALNLPDIIHHPLDLVFSQTSAAAGSVVIGE